MSKTLIAALLAAQALPAWAAVYKYVDADGSVTFTDRYRPGAVKYLDDGKGHVIGAPRQRSGTTSPAGFPRVDPGTQGRRDQVRRDLLLEERKAEEDALAGTRAQLADGKPRSAAERARLQETLRLHERNIEMLDAELARIK